MSRVAALVRKEIAVERGGRGLLATAVPLCAVLSVVAVVGVRASPLGRRAESDLFPCLAWLILVAGGAVGVESAGHAEREEGAVDGVRLSGVPAGDVFCAKVAVYGPLLWCVHLATSGLLALFLEVPLAGRAWPYAVVSLVSVCGYVSLAVLSDALVAGGRLRAGLVPLVVLPLAAPLLVSSVGSAAVVAGGGGAASDATEVLLIASVVHFLTGYLLYGKVLER